MRNSKHSETKMKANKIKFSNILLLILIIVAIVLIIIIGTKYSDRKKNDEAVKEVVSQINDEVQNSNDNDFPYIQYDGYQVIGTIQISKINIEYPILIESNEETLNKSITRVGDGTVNGIGNLTLAGHNYIDGSMFGKIDELEIDDELSILDLNGNRVTYKIFDKFVTDPNDVSVLEPVQENTREVTLITCINGNKNRLILKAREI